MPLRVAKKMYLPSSSRLRTASMVRTVSPGCSATRLPTCLPLPAAPTSGISYTLSQYTRPGVGEDQHVGVRRGDEQMLDEIFFARLHARAPGASAALLR